MENDSTIRGLNCPSKFALTSAEKEILHLLSEEFLTVKQIKQRRHCSLQAVYKIIKKLKKKGYSKKFLIFNRKFYENETRDRCYFCGFPIVNQHHILPKKDGGKNNDDNLINLCPNCHFLVHYGFKIVLKNGFYYMVDCNERVIREPNIRQIHYKFKEASYIKNVN